VALNPLSAEAVSNLGSCYLFTGQFEEALKESRRARTLGGDYASAAFYEAITLYELERYSEAEALLEGLVIPWVGSGVNTVRALVLAAQGKDAAARELLEPIRAAGHGFDEGLVLAALGEREAALDTFARTRLGGLDMAVSYWPSVAVRHLFERVWAPLRDDPRYAELRHQVDAIYGLA
jgi:tetratricopeptide (TPR) repeat protein